MFKIFKFNKPEILYPKYDAEVKWAFMKGVDIIINGEVYLRRLMILKCPWFSIYLHKFFKGDEDLCGHNHPFCFYTVILTHGYKEEVDGEVFFRKPRRIYYRPAEWTHRVILNENDPKPLTLVLTGPKVQEWGFFTKNGFVHWKDFKENRESHLC